MKTRLLSALLVFLLVALVSVPAVSAQPAPAAPVGGLAYDVIKEVLNPITERIPFFFKDQQIKHLTDNRDQAVKELSDYAEYLPIIQQNCLENHQNIMKKYDEILENRRTNKMSTNPLVMANDNIDIKNQISKNIDDYNCVIKRIDELKLQIVKLNALIKKEEERYQIMAQDAMKGHEIMQFIKNLTDENKQIISDYNNLTDVIRIIVKDNETLLEKLERR